jgi:hypothetical protein
MDANTQPDAVPVKRMTRVLVKTAATLRRGDACYLVNAYYAMQRQRESAEAQLRRASDSRPHEVIAWVIEQDRIVEKQIKRVLDEWSNAIPAARWAKGLIGVGPMIAASLAAHIDISKCRTVGQIWRFAGYDPTLKWARGTKCPWNRHLKRVCWLAGESFVKTSGHENGFYGRLYLARKRVEQEHNEAGQFAGQAREKLERFKIGSDTDARKWYEQGKLPPAQIHARAKRWAVKLFLAHYHHVAWVAATGTEPPKPYVITILGHDGFIVPPNFPEVQ